MQSLLRALYPVQCTACEEPLDTEYGLCAGCWSDTRFIEGVVCDLCGSPLPGDDPDEVALCDDCTSIGRPWDRGRAALVYTGVGRKLVLQFKHGDRTDLAPALATWLHRALPPLLDDETVFVPVPLHWSRLLRRRYNQAALLSEHLARLTGLRSCPDALMRTRRTPSLDGHTRDARFKAVEGAVTVLNRRKASIEGRSVVLVDDVMTSGATFAACTEACFAAGARRVCVAPLARVVKDV